MTQALAIARGSVDLTRPHCVSGMPNGAGALFVTDGPFGISRHLVRHDSVDPLGGPTSELARIIDEGLMGRPMFRRPELRPRARTARTALAGRDLLEEEDGA